MNVLVIFDGKSETVLLVLKFNKISWNCPFLEKERLNNYPWHTFTSYFSRPIFLFHQIKYQSFYISNLLL